MTDTDKSNTEMRVTLGPIAEEYFKDIPARKRKAFLENTLSNLQDGTPPPKEQVASNLDHEVVGALFARVFDVLDTLGNHLHQRCDQLLTEHVVNRGLLATLVTEGDDRRDAIERAQQVSDERQLGVDQIKKDLGIAMVAHRRKLSELVPQVNPVIVPEGMHEQANAEMAVQQKGFER